MSDVAITPIEVFPEPSDESGGGLVPQPTEEGPVSPPPVPDPGQDPADDPV